MSDVGIAKRIQEIGKIAGAVVGVAGALYGGGMWIFDFAMEERDAETRAMENEIESLNEKLEALQLVTAAQHGEARSWQERARDTISERFHENEVSAAELRGSVSSLRDEVRLRHGAPLQAAKNGTRRERIRRAQEDADRQTHRAFNLSPRGNPLAGL